MRSKLCTSLLIIFIVIFVSIPAAGFNCNNQNIIAEEDNVNLALNKPVKANTEQDSNKDATKAVDGDTSDASLWMSFWKDNEKTPKWLVVDLQDSYEIGSVDVFVGKVNGEWAIKNFKLQYLNGDADWDDLENADWQDIEGASITDNSDVELNLTFTPVNTKMIRFYCDDPKQIRVREIMIYEHHEDIEPDEEIDPETGFPIDPKNPDNIAYKRNVNASSQLSNGPVENAVDGIIADDSRWLTTNKEVDYWMDIDLGAEYTIISADIYTGKDDTSWAVHNFKLQYQKDEEWVDISGASVTNNSSTFQQLTFEEPVTTNKVRFYSDDGDRGVRVREILIFKGDEVTPPPKPPVERSGLKKIYADYHGPRYTRDMDGNLGLWKYSKTAKNSSVDDTYVNYNADIIDKSGMHQIASADYPLVGMQSQLDPDYNEYQILLAKTAHIDGFFVEWGFPEHSSNKQLENLQDIASQYKFEIGVNWCDAWHFYDWIKKYRPEIETRQDKVEAFKESFQYLLDNVYGEDTGALYEGHPIVYLFGGGPTPEEFEDIKNYSYDIPDDLKTPWFFRRAPINAKEDDGKVDFMFCNTDWHTSSNGKPLMDGPFGWMPNRARDAKSDGYDLWDKYGTKEDTIEYLKTLKQKFIEKDDEYKLRCSVVTPGMDNRGCAGWGSEFKMIPREDGDTYREMWEYNADNKDYVDVVYIVSWNDYTEGHQIEPTIEDGEREIRTTEEYAAMFKGIESEPSGIELPIRLFKLRKKARFLEQTGISADALMEELDNAGMLISDGHYADAENTLDDAEDLAYDLESDIETETIVLDVPSDEIIIKTSGKKNIAYNKPVTANYEEPDGIAENAVDGVISDDSMWITMNDEDSCWLEIDLEDTYNLIGSDIITGKDDGSEVVQNMKLQYWCNDSWIDIPGASAINNLNTEVSFEFTNSVNTNKVRFYSEDDSCIIKEIKIYSNEIPTVSIVSPDNDSTYKPGLNVTINAIAEDSDGDIVKVEFYKNGKILPGEDIKEIGQNEYSYDVKGLRNKAYVFTVKVYDNNGATAESEPISIHPPMINVAINKPVKANSVVGSNVPENAVDGIVSADSRWCSTQSEDVYWLEINLQEQFNLVRADVFTGSTGVAWPVHNFKLEYWDGSSWVQMPGTSVDDNLNVELSFEFETPIATDKVRFYSEEGNRGVRVKEIMLYSYELSDTDEDDSKPTEPEDPDTDEDDSKPSVHHVSKKDNNNYSMDIVQKISKILKNSADKSTNEIKLEVEKEISSINKIKNKNLAKKIEDEIIEYTINQKLIDKKIIQINKAINEIEKSKLKKLINSISKDVIVELENEEDDEVKIIISSSTAKQLLNSKINLVIDKGNIKLKVLPKKLQSNDSNIEINLSKLSKKSFKDYMNINKKDELIPTGNFFDFSCNTNNEMIAEFHYDIKNINNEDRLGVYCYNLNTEKWDYIANIIDKKNKLIKFKTNKYSTYAVMEYDKTFDDTVGHKYEDAVKLLASKHIVKGIDDVNFAPQAEINRAEFITMIIRTLQLDLKEYKNNYDDVLDTQWYADIIQTAADEELIENSDKKFRPEDIITIEEIANITMNAYKLAAKNEIMENSIATNLSDNNAMKFLKQLNILDDNILANFLNRKYISRAEAAEIVKNLIESLY